MNSHFTAATIVSSFAIQNWKYLPLRSSFLVLHYNSSSKTCSIFSPYKYLGITLVWRQLFFQLFVFNFPTYHGFFSTVAFEKIQGNILLFLLSHFPIFLIYLFIETNITCILSVLFPHHPIKCYQSEDFCLHWLSLHLHCWKFFEGKLL